MISKSAVSEFSKKSKIKDAEGAGGDDDSDVISYYFMTYLSSMNDNIDLSLFQGEKEETFLLRPIYVRQF